MFGNLLLCAIGLVLFSAVNSDDIPYSIPAGQPAGTVQYVLIEKPWLAGVSNFEQWMDSHLLTFGSPKEMNDDTLQPGEKRCPVDGDPHCRDCVAGYKSSDLVQSQCCFAHHWAWKNQRSIRDVLPYRFHLAPVKQTEPPSTVINTQRLTTYGKPMCARWSQLRLSLMDPTSRAVSATLARKLDEMEPYINVCTLPPDSRTYYVGRDNETVMAWLGRVIFNSALIWLLLSSDPI
ncbi:uncharacterized protein LOC129598481 [Paramacrobiotus metropolitanus]|uniref:uncharacterized protein LOC129598481 n=1 Tax=Paramacrobiotus metropolitanus TaxID=2943436 RepID=UPI002445A592|nr:uncharacterized protein LOC129598481 [Paramacrobiotus metropolitanus]